MKKLALKTRSRNNFPFHSKILAQPAIRHSKCSKSILRSPFFLFLTLVFNFRVFWTLKNWFWRFLRDDCFAIFLIAKCDKDIEFGRNAVFVEVHPRTNHPRVNKKVNSGNHMGQKFEPRSYFLEMNIFSKK